jgi:Pyridoxamine 5'-phosphate oxidase
VSLSYGERPNWPEVAALLAPARSYWLGTTSGDGSPHVAPVWGVIVDAHFYVYSERKTKKAKNLSRDSRGVVHLESAEEVVIVHGHFDDIGAPMDAPAVVQALCAKYVSAADSRYLPSNDDAFDVLYVLRPEKAHMWSLSDFDGTQRLWTASRVSDAPPKD